MSTFDRSFQDAVAGGSYAEAECCLREIIAGARHADDLARMSGLIGWALEVVRSARAHDAAELASLKHARRYLGSQPASSICAPVTGVPVELLG